MAEAVISPVVPPPPAAHRGGRPVRAAAPARGPLPLPRLAAVRTSATVYGLAVLDCRGRVADRAVLGALGWRAGTRLEIRTTGGLLVINADPRGRFGVTGAGHLRLPAPVRRWCGLGGGDRVLLAAEPVAARLVVHPPAALDAMIEGCHHALQLGGEPA